MGGQNKIKIKERTIKTNFRLEVSLLDEIDKQAEIEHRDRTGLIKHALKTYLENVRQH